MVLGADTGFFVAYANNHLRATEIWQELIDGLHTIVVSTLTINEILVYFYKLGNSQQEWVDLMLQTDNVNIVPVSIQIALDSAKYRYSLGLPTVDSVILATFLEYSCDKMFSTDGHFRIVDEQKILPVEFLA
jgi:predicted nucleic acid-binding protein